MFLNAVPPVAAAAHGALLTLILLRVRNGSSSKSCVETEASPITAIP
jgi:hypothetical protein